MDYSGEDLLLGLYKIHKEAAEAPWALKEHDLPKGYWRRVINPDEGAEAFCIIITDRYVIGIKTGRVIFLDKKTKKRLDPIPTVAVIPVSASTSLTIIFAKS